MYDLHCHLLPAIDDGPVDLDTALEMARMAVADGITTVACTPHIYPGVYENTAAGIRDAIGRFRLELARNHIELTLLEGADVHLAPDLCEGIRAGRIPTLAGSRYLLLEPPHHVAPPRFEETVFELMTQGIVPVITHPERLSWVESHFDVFARLAARGAWMQITAGALTGRFGSRPRNVAERFVGEGLCMILATDAHHVWHRVRGSSRSPDADSTKKQTDCCPRQIANTDRLCYLRHGSDAAFAGRLPAPHLCSHGGVRPRVLDRAFR